MTDYQAFPEMTAARREDREAAADPAREQRRTGQRGVLGAMYEYVPEMAEEAFGRATNPATNPLTAPGMAIGRFLFGDVRSDEAPSVPIAPAGAQSSSAKTHADAFPGPAQPDPRQQRSVSATGGGVQMPPWTPVFHEPPAWAPYKEDHGAPIQITRDAAGRVVGASNTGAPLVLPGKAGEGSTSTEMFPTRGEDPTERQIHSFLGAIDDPQAGGVAQYLYGQMSPAEQRLSRERLMEPFVQRDLVHREQMRREAEAERAHHADVLTGLQAFRERGRIEDEATINRVLQGKTPEEWKANHAKLIASQLVSDGVAGLPGLADPAGRAAKRLPPTELTPQEQAAIKAHATAAADQALQNLIFTAYFPQTIRGREPIMGRTE